jgi:hypothetical protein
MATIKLDGSFAIVPCGMCIVDAQQIFLGRVPRIYLYDDLVTLPESRPWGLRVRGRCPPGWHHRHSAAGRVPGVDIELDPPQALHNVYDTDKQCHKNCNLNRASDAGDSD